jgi:hypothetical protein
MLCTFTTKEGTLIVRSDDIKRIADQETHTLLAWLEGELICTARITGTAAENRDRILQEELDQIGTVELHRYRTQQLLQAQPQPRGRQGGR